MEVLVLSESRSTVPEIRVSYFGKFVPHGHPSARCPTSDPSHEYRLAGSSHSVSLQAIFGAVLERPWYLLRPCLCETQRIWSGSDWTCSCLRKLRCDDTNKTPFDLASDNAQLDVANLLSPSAMAKEEEADLSTSSIGPQTQYPDVARSPQPRRGNENSVNNDEQLSMCTASENVQIEVVRSLLDLASDIEEKDSERRTPWRRRWAPRGSKM